MDGAPAGAGVAAGVGMAAALAVGAALEHTSLALSYAALSQATSGSPGSHHPFASAAAQAALAHSFGPAAPSAPLSGLQPSHTQLGGQGSSLVGAAWADGSARATPKVYKKGRCALPARVGGHTLQLKLKPYL